MASFANILFHDRYVQQFIYCFSGLGTSYRKIRNGDLVVLKGLLKLLLLKKDLHFTSAATSFAAEQGNLTILQLLKRRGVSCNEDAMNKAAKYGHLHVVKWLKENIEVLYPRDSYIFTNDAIDNAAENGHLETIIYIYNQVFPLWMASPYIFCTTNAIDSAAENGHLNVIKFLHGIGANCTIRAIDSAAENGYLEVIQFLHENCDAQCSDDALDAAAGNGHLHVVQWIHTHPTVIRIGCPTCTTFAMDWAAENGHLYIVEWLHQNRQEGCSVRAASSAAAAGHMQIVKFLYEHYPGVFVYEEVKKIAEQYWRKSIVQWLETLN